MIRSDVVRFDLSTKRSSVVMWFNFVIMQSDLNKKRL